jgi:ABC-2 type transport system permease protein
MLLPVLLKELRYYFSSLTAYVVIGIFLIATGLFLWVIPGTYNIIDSGYANVDGLFILAPWLFLFLCPAITMKSIAEEKQSGTWELLISRPISISNIVVGKFLAAWILVVLAQIPAILYFMSVYQMAVPVGNVDSGAFTGSFLGLILLSAAYLSIGIFSSSLATNQILTFIISLVLCFLLFYGFELGASFFSSGSVIMNLQDAGIHAHYQSISRGVIESGDLIYFCLVTILFLFLSVKLLKFRK